MKKATVIGWPISHSRSPLIHNHWIRQYGIDGSYEKLAVPPEDLGSYLTSLKNGECVGTNVTIPHKENATAFIDEPDDRVRRIGALNTVWRENGRLHATSTDGPGFVANISHTLPGSDITSGPVTMLGAGGSARSIIDELLRQGVPRINVYNRTQVRAEALAQHFGPHVVAVDPQQLARVLGDTQFFINTTPAGMAGAKELELPWASLNGKAIVADIVYTPLVTPFLETARARGHAIVPGLGMLLHQAVLGFEKWFGVRPQVTQDLHDIVASDIAAGSKP